MFQDETSADGDGGGARPARVLVLGSEYRAGPWAIRSLRSAGHTVIAADRSGHAGRSRECLSPRRFPPPEREPRGFAHWVGDTCRAEGVDVVLPVSEDAVRALAEALPDLGTARLAGPDARQYAALCDKASLADTARAARVAHPATEVIAVGDHHTGRPPPPVVVKPRTSGESASVPAAVVAWSEGQIRTAVAALHAAGMDALVQDLLVGPRWSLHGVRFRGGGVLAVALRVIDTFPRDAGTSSVLRTGPAPPALWRVVRRLTAAVDYVGPVSLNLVEQDGVFVVHDVNLRLSSSIGASMRSGLDVPALAVRAAMGLCEPGPCAGTTHAYVRWDGEMAAIRAARASTPGSVLPLAARLGRAVIDPRTVVDPWPLDPVFLGTRALLRGVAAGSRARAALRRP